MGSTLSWRRTWISLMPFLAVLALTAACAALLPAPGSSRAFALGLVALLLGLTLTVKCTTVEISNGCLSYRGKLRHWQLLQSRINLVDVPSNYRLLYIIFETDDGKRRSLPILNFGSPKTLSRVLLEFVPDGALSGEAREVLRRLASGERPDRPIRWRQLQPPES